MKPLLGFTFARFHLMRFFAISCDFLRSLAIFCDFAHESCYYGLRISLFFWRYHFYSFQMTTKTNLSYTSVSVSIFFERDGVEDGGRDGIKTLFFTFSLNYQKNHQNFRQKMLEQCCCSTNFGQN
jgi:hypothetical protein